MSISTGHLQIASSGWTRGNGACREDGDLRWEVVNVSICTRGTERLLHEVGQVAWRFDAGHCVRTARAGVQS